MAQVSGIEVRFSGNTQPLEAAVGKAEGALNSFGKTASNVIPANFGSKVQQASYQIQDFAVQVASGSRPLKARRRLSAWANARASPSKTGAVVSGYGSAIRFAAMG